MEHLSLFSVLKVLWTSLCRTFVSLVTVHMFDGQTDRWAALQSERLACIHTMQRGKNLGQKQPTKPSQRPCTCIIRLWVDKPHDFDEKLCPSGQGQGLMSLMLTVSFALMYMYKF